MTLSLLDQEDRRTIFCSNLNNERISEKILHELFLQAGPIDKVAIPVDKSTNTPRGFAFISFRHEVSVMYAITLLDGISLFGKPLRLKPRENKNPGGGGASSSRRSSSVPNEPLPFSFKDFEVDDPTTNSGRHRRSPIVPPLGSRGRVDRSFSQNSPASTGVNPYMTTVGSGAHFSPITGGVSPAGFVNSFMAATSPLSQSYHPATAAVAAAMMFSPHHQLRPPTPLTGSPALAGTPAGLFQQFRFPHQQQELMQHHQQQHQKQQQHQYSPYPTPPRNQQQQQHLTPTPLFSSGDVDERRKSSTSSSYRHQPYASTAASHHSSGGSSSGGGRRSSDQYSSRHGSSRRESSSGSHSRSNRRR